MSRSARLVLDVSAFQSSVDEAVGAFEMDASYAISMARQAVMILHKRRVWKLRLDLRNAEREAQRQCMAKGSFVCRATSPCGTGDCPFAVTTMTTPAKATSPGKGRRPQPSQNPSYDLEQVVRELAAVG